MSSATMYSCIKHYYISIQFNTQYLLTHCSIEFFQLQVYVDPWHSDYNWQGWCCFYHKFVEMNYGSKFLFIIGYHYSILMSENVASKWLYTESCKNYFCQTTSYDRCSYVSYLLAKNEVLSLYDKWKKPTRKTFFVRTDDMILLVMLMTELAVRRNDSIAAVTELLPLNFFLFFLGWWLLQN